MWWCEWCTKSNELKFSMFSTYDSVTQISFILDRPALKDGRKLHCCLYCKYWGYRIARHMERKRKNEPRVANIMKIQSKPKKNKEYAKLRKEGDYASNIKRLKDKNFNLTVVRNGKISKEKCVPCLNCLGHFNPKTLKKKNSKHCAGESYKSEKKPLSLRKSRMFLASTIAAGKKLSLFLPK